MEPCGAETLLDTVLPGLRVDRDRMHLTGWSLGVNGA